METRANHLIIGSFVLLFVAAMFGFVFWIAKLQVDREFAYYDIFFTDAVSGLGEGGDVRFNGIKVGAVDRIVIDREDPSRVRVTIAVDSETPVRTDSAAQLELQGITGVSYVQISGGSRTAELMPGANRRTDNHPTIRARPSKIAELFQAAPELLARALEVMDRVNTLLSEENQEAIAGTLVDIRTVTSSLAQREAAIGRIIDAFDRSSGDVAAAAKSVREITQQIDALAREASQTLTTARTAMSNVDKLVTNDAGPLIADSRRTAASLAALADEMQGILAENREAIRGFTGDGVGEFRQFLNEARILVASLARVANRLEEDPSQILFGARESEFRPENK
jgi:phospholipid/cholesterol/gamma-HCH transport system substrate-binding protein